MLEAASKSSRIAPSATSPAITEAARWDIGRLTLAAGKPVDTESVSKSHEGGLQAPRRLSPALGTKGERATVARLDKRNADKPGRGEGGSDRLVTPERALDVLPGGSDEGLVMGRHPAAACGAGDRTTKWIAARRLRVTARNRIPLTNRDSSGWIRTIDLTIMSRAL